MTTNTTAAPRRSATHTRDLILSTLAGADEPVTVTELAERAGMGKSTLSKHLPALEGDGLAVRARGGREGRRRLPDTWQAATTAPFTPDTAAEETEVDVLISATQETSAQVTSEQATEDEATASDNQSSPATGTPVPPISPRPDTADGGTATATVTRVGAATEQDLNPVSGSTRLAPGELKLMVKAILDSDPGEEFTATAISHILQGRSIGAIQNNLARLAKEGRVVQTCARPRRYRSAQHSA
ncbi:winged helix-turn-helix domain-containing protein [Nocardiopsis sp. CT-R113]|uniref:Winged helix-turn-helix domain-containing protein n=1 Tax=Nocardiopsis codii TaxID=3065942 RepID=A0ABU7KBH6_9ACTN|nr:winged helix-turn-helix domain-containing protein [Nocardiopsis sp. CT-R113]MEE2038922.1 winged helix-turn-helix domain-containing protein [Nocardiopsis sp. CT-R113]